MTSEFGGWHRAASENLITAAGTDTDVIGRLNTARDFGRKALLAAGNARERMLAMGLLMTVEGIRTLHNTGLETTVIKDEEDHP